MKERVRCYSLFFVLVAFGLAFASCGGGGAVKNGIDGVWKTEKGDEIVKINLAGENKTVEFDGQVHKAVIEKEDDKTVIVRIEEGETQSTVSFSRMWNDNGSDFTLVFLLPDGSRWDLIAQSHS